MKLKIGLPIIKVLGILSIGFAFAAPAAAGEIVSCVYLKVQGEHRCIIKGKPEEPMRAGDEVIAYQKGIYWAGTGTVLKVKGLYSVASFKNAGNGLSQGLRAEIRTPTDNATSDYSTAFSQLD